LCGKASLLYPFQAQDGQENLLPVIGDVPRADS
jgi:hypothetical protein